ncbi:DUF63 family protein [Haloparvum sedimenti]|uniref:DUF63 family protein n=1 Tax=Haloparvum sedimenti TaxID=1678448 RepID=UPI00071E7B8E|nr:DUF63 family protein [Haloparvum sedimenti]
MQLLPEGFALPPLPYLAALVLALAAVGAGLRARRPAVTERTVLAFAPWIAVGSCLHVLHVAGGLPPVARPLGGTPAVYLTTAAAAGAVWVAADVTEGTSPETDRVPALLGGVGLAAFALAAAATLLAGAEGGTLSPFWPAVALALSVPTAAATWLAVVRAVPRAAVTGAVGALATFGHALDAVSTAVGVDVLGFGERSPLSRHIMDAAAALPTADLIGVGWLFVLVKLAVIAGVVALFAEYVEEDPAEGYLLLGFVAAVGLGPGVHNLFLFTVA